MSYWTKRLNFLFRRNLIVKEAASHLKHKDGRTFAKELPVVSIAEVAGTRPGRVLPVEFADGNVSEVEIEYLARIAQHYAPERVFEIGTFNGRTAMHLAENTPPSSRIFTLDLPKSAMATTLLRIKSGERKFIDKDRPGELFRDTPYAAKITQLLGDSAQFDYAPYNGTMDLVFIDGSHSYEYVLNDTEVAFRLLRDGKGIIVWHDYGWKEVIQALNEYRRNDPRCKEIVHIEGTTLAFLKVGR